MKNPGAVSSRCMIKLVAVISNTERGRERGRFGSDDLLKSVPLRHSLQRLISQLGYSAHDAAAA